MIVSPCWDGEASGGPYHALPRALPSVRTSIITEAATRFLAPFPRAPPARGLALSVSLLPIQYRILCEAYHCTRPATFADLPGGASRGMN